MNTALKAVAGITACAGTYYILRQLTSSSSSRKKYAGLKKIPEPKGAYPYLGEYPSSYLRGLHSYTTNHVTHT